MVVRTESLLPCQSQACMRGRLWDSRGKKLVDSVRCAGTHDAQESRISREAHKASVKEDLVGLHMVEDMTFWSLAPNARTALQLSKRQLGGFQVGAMVQRRVWYACWRAVR